MTDTDKRFRAAIKLGNYPRYWDFGSAKRVVDKMTEAELDYFIETGRYDPIDRVVIASS